jgi:hypothetical protein
MMAPTRRGNITPAVGNFNKKDNTCYVLYKKCVPPTDLR